MITVWVLLIMFDPLGGTDFSQVAVSKAAYRTERECQQARLEVWARPGAAFLPKETRCAEVFAPAK